MEHVITVEDIDRVKERLEKVWQFAFPLALDWEETCSVSYQSRCGAYWKRYRVGFNFPRCARPDGRTFPNGADGYLFMGAETSFSCWEDLLEFVDWMEGIQTVRLVGFRTHSRCLNKCI